MDFEIQTSLVGEFNSDFEFLSLLHTSFTVTFEVRTTLDREFEYDFENLTSAMSLQLTSEYCSCVSIYSIHIIFKLTHVKNM